MIGRTKTRRVGLVAILGISVTVGALVLMFVLPAIAMELRQSPASQAAPDLTATCGSGDAPLSAGYDPVTHEMYVPNFDSNSITVFKGTCTLAGTITLPTGAQPAGVAFSPANNNMYVTDNGLNVVYEISGLKVTHTIKGTAKYPLDQPHGIVYDPGDQVMVVANRLSDDVTLIFASAVENSYPVGDYPQGIAYDPYEATILVANYNSNNVTILSALTLAHVADVPVGSCPSGVAFDYADDYDYVANACSNNVSVMNGLGESVGTVSGLAAPWAVTWDQSTLQIFVTDSTTGNVTVIGGSNGLTLYPKLTIAEGSDARGIAYDEANDALYISGYATDEVYVTT